MQTYESDTNIGSIKILAVDMDKTLLTDKRVLPQGLDERLDKLAGVRDQIGVLLGAETVQLQGRRGCAGLLLLEAYWNRYAFVHELAVDREWRGRGVGTRLMDCAKAWAQERRLHGLMLETQDDNLLACRFYRKYGMRIGGVDELLYAGFGSREKAVFWYLELD